ncbi:MAG: 3'-5' exonuclease [Candidatus Brocadia sp.]|nr:3'-5' exonuclease [Candidatus Brocadia sp.]
MAKNGRKIIEIPDKEFDNRINEGVPVIGKKTKGQNNGCFVAIDFETADFRPDSACSIGLVRVVDNRIVDRTHCLIRPPRRTFVFTYLHGISWKHVANEPAFHELWPYLAEKLKGAEFLAAHNAPFDRSVLMACCQSAGLSPPAIPFQCTVRLARKVWNLRPANLPGVCAFLGIPLKHHDAVSDAEACARIVIEARICGNS